VAREHARIALTNVELAFERSDLRERVPGGGLLRA
jgi:hypothetical protein